MDATTTHLMSWLIQKLSQDNPDILFEEGEVFSWSPTKRTVFYKTNELGAPALLLHETSHALLEHRNYQRDVELVSMEAAAWDKAKEYATELEAEYAKSFKVVKIVTEDQVQDHLDTYREWLHNRSTCPKCTAIGYQTDPLRYACPACSHKWRVNEARVCALRRYSE